MTKTKSEIAAKSNTPANSKGLWEEITGTDNHTHTHMLWEWGVHGSLVGCSEPEWSHQEEAPGLFFLYQWRTPTINSCSWRPWWWKKTKQGSPDECFDHGEDWMVVSLFPGSNHSSLSVLLIVWCSGILTKRTQSQHMCSGSFICSTLQWLHHHHHLILQLMLMTNLIPAARKRADTQAWAHWTRGHSCRWFPNEQAQPATKNLPIRPLTPANG